MDIPAALGKGQHMPFAHKEHDFLQCHRDIVVTCGQYAGFDAVALAAMYPYLQHLLRQVDIAPAGVLLIDRGDQQAFTDHHLVLYLTGKGVLREGKRQRHTVHTVVQGGFHILAVKVGQQQVAQL